MRGTTKLLGAAAVAGIVATGGSAFTASNTLPAGSVMGYGQVVSTGATITAITNTLSTTDASKLASVAFASSTDVTGKTVKMTLKSGTAVVGTPYACTLGAYATGTMTITCATADNPLMNAFDTTGITVL
jgi:hypothetical protein